MRIHLERLLRIFLLITLVNCEPDGTDKDKDNDKDKDKDKIGLDLDKLHPYYAISDEDVRSGNFKAVLTKVLSSHHITEDGKRDILTDNCEKHDLKPEQDCKKQKVLGYKGARKQLFGNIHLEGSEDDNSLSVKSIYCLKKFTQADFGDSPNLGKMKIPLHTIMNTEHVWPQSRFKNNESKESKGSSIFTMKKSDLHILYPSESKINGARGNFQFGEVTEVTKDFDCNDEAKLGKITTSTGEISEDIYFEPPNESKGNIARALFYFSVRYDVPIHDEEERFLRQWHKDDPVETDDMEIRRNEMISELQNIRNPFIDYPEMVEMIDNF